MSAINSGEIPIEEEARKLISQDRRAEYGAVEDSFSNIAFVWTGILRNKLKRNDITIDGPTVALLMTGLKLVREANKEKRDNRVDAVAYILLEDQLVNSSK